MRTRLSITPSAKDAFTVGAKLAGYDGQATLHWGDGSTPTHTVATRTYEHRYPAIGKYMITIVDGSGVLIARQQIAVTGAIGLDEVRVADDDAAIRVSFGDIDPRLGVSQYRVEWQDADDEWVWGVPGRALRHDATPGVHTVVISDTSSGRTQTWTVQVTHGPVYDPDFTVHHFPGDASGMTVYVRLATPQIGRPIHVWWDDADGPQLIQRPIPGMEIPHIYTHPGHYMQTLAYADSHNIARAKSDAMTVPSTNTRKFSGKQNPAGAIEGSLSASSWAQRFSRRGDRNHSFLRGLRADPQGSAGNLAIDSGVEEPSVNGDGDQDSTGLPTAHDGETTGRIPFQPGNGPSSAVD